ncbi:MAG: saccharopine dehydrogenase NADP-binding domain-containing protein [Polyangiaceae bacterium]
MPSRGYDITLLGASGYTGRLVGAYLSRALAASKSSPARWAIAGRNRAKLEEIASAFEGTRPDIVVVDVDSKEGVARLAGDTRVLCSTAGPYDVLGRGVVAACAAQGTHYCDITGEVPFVRHSIDTHHDEAIRTKARIVHCCGFDSVPSDIGVYLLQKEALLRFGAPLHRVDFVVLKTRGGFSGGTAQSLIGVLDAASRDPEAMRSITDPYGLSPKGTTGNDRDASTWKKSPFRGVPGYVAPFFMGPVNARVVRRSNALLEELYGFDFRYREWMCTGKGAKGYATAAGLTVGMGALFTLGQEKATRRLLARWFPKSGEGPTKEQRESGFYRIRLFGTRNEEASLDLRVEGDQDPGYGDTAKMLGESALALAYDDLPENYGVVTPAYAMGDALAARLRAAGIRFELETP